MFTRVSSILCGIQPWVSDRHAMTAQAFVWVSKLMVGVSVNNGQPSGLWRTTGWRYHGVWARTTSTELHLFPSRVHASVALPNQMWGRAHSRRCVRSRRLVGTCTTHAGDRDVRRLSQHISTLNPQYTSKLWQLRISVCLVLCTNVRVVASSSDRDMLAQITTSIVW